MRDRGSTVRIYDFRNPDRFSKEEIRALELVCANLARHLTTYLSAKLRAVAYVELQSVEQLSYDQVFGDLEVPSALAPVKLKPLPGYSVVVFDKRASGSVIERIFGAPSQYRWEETWTADGIRGFTDIEQIALRRAMDAVVGAIADTWKDVLAVSPEVVAIESSPLFIQGFAPGEALAVAKFSFRMGERGGWIRFCMPLAIVEPLLSKLSKLHWYGSARAGAAAGAQRMALKDLLPAIPVELRAVLGSAAISLEDVAGLAVGDVVVLNRRIFEPISLLVEGKPKFSARPVLSGKTLAVVVVGVAPEAALELTSRKEEQAAQGEPARGPGPADGARQHFGETTEKARSCHEKG